MRLGLISDNLNSALVPEASDMQHRADCLRVMRFFVAEVMQAGPEGTVISTRSALFQIACRMLNDGPDERGSTRTALMALRDLVWRVDSVRSVLATHEAEPALTEALKLLDTSDIHLFLKQEP